MHLVILCSTYFELVVVFNYIGMQVFVDGNCKILDMSSNCCSSTHDGTAYALSELCKFINSPEFPLWAHVVLDEAYKCTDKELSPWKGSLLEFPFKDAFNYYESLHRQPAERTFGMVNQTWGILWRVLRINISRIPLVLRVICKLHNINIDRFQSNYDVLIHPDDVNWRLETERGVASADILYDDRTGIHRGSRTDLHVSSTRNRLTEHLRTIGRLRPAHARHRARVTRVADR